VLLVEQDRDKIFTIDVSTEVTAFTITDPVLSEWTLGETRLIEDPFGDIGDGRLVRDHALLTIEPGTRVLLQRHGVGLIRIQLSSNPKESLGTIEQIDGRRIHLAGWALLLVKVNDRPMVFPFRGTLSAGDDVAVGVDSILLGGTVSVVEKQLIGETHYIAGEETLDWGDRVRLWRNPSEGSQGPRQATVSGFVRAEGGTGFSEPANALTLVAHGQADYVRVERLGSSGYYIRAPRWARFLRDPLLAACTAIIALIALLFELLSKCGALIGDLAREKGKGQSATERQAQSRPEGDKMPDGPTDAKKTTADSEVFKPK
jgi:hypothetical protein